MSDLLPEIVFARSQWIPWALGFAVVLLLVSMLSYRGSAMPLRWRLLAWTLRLAGIGLLLFCWLEPMASVERPKPQANTLAVLVDNSGSMRPLVDQPDISDLNPNRPLDATIASFRQVLSDDAAWVLKATEDFRVRKYLFDTSASPIDSFQDWNGTGLSSSIHQALRGIEDRYRGQPLAGIVLLSDGRSTDAASATAAINAAAALQIPVFPVRLERNAAFRDLRIEKVSVLQSEFETAPIAITATVSHTGYDGTDAKIELIDASGALLETQTLRLGPEESPKSAVFRFRPESSGVSAYSLVVRSTTDTSWSTSQLLSNPELRSPAEITLGNNRRFQVVDRGMGPYRILYLAGRPNWEYKFLRRALDEDAELSLTSLVRIAKKEMKFSFRNSKMESTNPLFSGFEDISEEEKEQYDEPVFARLGVQSEGELKQGFPKDAGELFEFHAIIIDDLEHEFLTLDQQQLLRQFVAVRGGALVVLGGQESMRGKGFRDSILGQLLPVYGDAKPIEVAIPAGIDFSTESLRFQLTRDGWLQSFLRLSDNESAERKRLEEMPGFQVWNDTSQLKPGASVLVEGEQADGTKIPLLVSQRFGRGRTSAMMLGDFWRWGLKFEGEGTSPLFQAWRQIMRAMIADVPRSIQIRPSIDPSNPRSANIAISVAGPDFESVDNAIVSLEFRGPGMEAMPVVAQPSETKVGEYESSWIMNAPGVYSVTANVRAADGSLLGTQTSGWVHEPSATEYARLGIDDAFLNRIAEESGGRVLDIDQLDQLGGLIPMEKVPIREVRVFPFWHSPWILCIAISCIALEWLLRRRYGLV